VNAGTTFTGNHADIGFGGAILNHGTLSATSVTFTSNHAAAAGGGISNIVGTANLTGCTFTANNAAVGGALNNDVGGMTVSGCQLESNSADEGGGIENFGGVLNVLSGCVISGNTATTPGGGIITELNGTTNIYDSEVRDNTPDDTHTYAGSTLNVVNSIVPKQT
jgi:hypothetical protein